MKWTEVDGRIPDEFLRKDDRSFDYNLLVYGCLETHARTYTEKTINLVSCYLTKNMNGETICVCDDQWGGEVNNPTHYFPIPKPPGYTDDEAL